MGVVRFLGSANHANMGSYRDAINAYPAGKTPVPDVPRTASKAV
jgi:hypothetical protein